MFEALRAFLQKNFSASGQGHSDTEARVRLSAATLFVEVMQADHEVDERERAAVHRALQSAFGISGEEAEAIVAESERQADHVVSLHALTSTLNQHLSIEEKIRLLEQIWKIVVADNQIERHEEHLVRRIADLLHLRHSEYIQAKLRVTEQG